MQIYEEKSAEFVDFASEMRGFESKEACQKIPKMIFKSKSHNMLIRHRI